jgi:hypothetical protein
MQPVPGPIERATMTEGTTYEERIYSTWNILLMGIVVLALLAVLVRQLAEGPLGANPAPNSLLIGLILLFVVTGLNFATLTVRVTIHGISVGYGIIRHQIPWGEVVGCRLDETPAARYGGWGIRMASIGGKKRLVYNILGVQRVIIEKRLGTFQKFAFSTRNPDAVMEAIKTGLGKKPLTRLSQP